MALPVPLRGVVHTSLSMFFTWYVCFSKPDTLLLVIVLLVHFQAD